MHVESVAWISERKDVMYVFFFLLSCISYIKYLKNKKIIFLFLSLFLFILSCLSKAMAVVLPMVLLLIDYLIVKKVNIKLILGKIPFFIISILIGITAFNIQSNGAIAKFEAFSIFQRLCFASYGFLMYWVKLIIPYNLSAIYPYPGLNTSGNIPFIYQVSPYILMISLILIFYLAYKKKKYFKTIVFGISFFIVTIILVIQIISVGIAVMADRYSYLSYVGAFFMVFSITNPILENSKKKSLMFFLIIGISLIFSIISFNRVKVWKNSETLWTDVIDKYPYKIKREPNLIVVEQKGIPSAYIGRGNYYKSKNNLEKAFADFNLLVEINTDDIKAYTNTGSYYGTKLQEAIQKGKQDEANYMFEKTIETLNKGLNIDKNNYEILFNRGITYAIVGKHKEAINDFLKVKKLNPKQSDLEKNMAISYFQLNDFTNCLPVLTKLINENANDESLFFYRGTAYFKQNNFRNALSDLKQAITINSKYASAWYNLSITQNTINQFNDAYQSAQKAEENGFQIPPQYMQTLKSKIGK